MIVKRFPTSLLHQVLVFPWWEIFVFHFCNRFTLQFLNPMNDVFIHVLSFFFIYKFKGAFLFQSSVPLLWKKISRKTFFSFGNKQKKGGGKVTSTDWLGYSHIILRILNGFPTRMDLCMGVAGAGTIHAAHCSRQCCFIQFEEPYCINIITISYNQIRIGFSSEVYRMNMNTFRVKITQNKTKPNQTKQKAVFYKY